MSTTFPPGERALLRRDAERNRQLILAAARGLIAERGFGVGYEEIAREAGVGIGTVYRRFPTRDRLHYELYVDRVDAVVAIAEAALAVDDPWAALGQFMERDFELQTADRGLREFQLGRADSDALNRVATGRIKPLVEALVARAQAAGQLRPDVGEGDIAIVLTMVGALMDASIGIDPGLWRRYLAMILDGLRDGGSRGPLPGLAPDRPRVEEILTRWVLPPRGRPRSDEPAASVDPSAPVSAGSG